VDPKGWTSVLFADSISATPGAGFLGINLFTKNFAKFLNVLKKQSGKV